MKDIQKILIRLPKNTYEKGEKCIAIRFLDSGVNLENYTKFVTNLIEECYNKNENSINKIKNNE